MQYTIRHNSVFFVLKVIQYPSKYFINTFIIEIRRTLYRVVINSINSNYKSIKLNGLYLKKYRVRQTYLELHLVSLFRFRVFVVC